VRLAGLVIELTSFTGVGLFLDFESTSSTAFLSIIQNQIDIIKINRSYHKQSLTILLLISFFLTTGSSILGL